MKRIVFMLVILSGMCIVTNVYAAEIKIKSVKNNIVTCTLANSAENQEITIFVSEENEEYGYSEDKDKVVYMNQFTPNIKENTFSFEIKPLDYATDEDNNAKYVVRIGGTDINEPQTEKIILLKKDDQASDGIIVGDVNCDGVIDKEDAALLMKYILNPESVAISEEGLENAKFNDEAITVTNVIKILQRINSQK